MSNTVEYAFPSVVLSDRADKVSLRSVALLLLISCFSRAVGLSLLFLMALTGVFECLECTLWWERVLWAIGPSDTCSGTIGSGLGLVECLGVLSGLALVLDLGFPTTMLGCLLVELVPFVGNKDIFLWLFGS